MGFSNLQWEAEEEEEGRENDQKEGTGLEAKASNCSPIHGTQDLHPGFASPDPVRRRRSTRRSDPSSSSRSRLGSRAWSEISILADFAGRGNGYYYWWMDGKVASIRKSNEKIRRKTKCFPFGHFTQIKLLPIIYLFYLNVCKKSQKYNFCNFDYNRKSFQFINLVR